MIPAPLIVVAVGMALERYFDLDHEHVYMFMPDHPILPSIPETEYLKGFAFELVR